MAQFIITNILMLSFGGMLVIAARALPRLNEEETARRKNVFEHLIQSGVTERLDSAFHGFAVKFLRKSKVHLLKLENFVTAKLKNMTPENSSPFAGNGKTNGEAKQIDFKDILDEKEENK